MRMGRRWWVVADPGLGLLAAERGAVIGGTGVDKDGDGVPESPSTGTDGFRVPPLQRRLHGQAAAEFAVLLNQLPDRNGAWRDWQRRHSGFWPDAPWDNGSWDAE